ncbi:MAG: hypothetical protein QOE64_928, partial [Frankiales bacterium]|nr:hypothetical protein [Frankiales bacterium]
MRPLPARLALAAAGLGLLASGISVAGSATAAGADQSITAPSKAGKTATVAWTGTIPVGASVLLVGDPLAVCDEADPTKGDRHTIQVTLPASLPKGVQLTGMFSMDWDSPNGGVEDEKLVVLDPHGAVIGDSDTGGQTFETAPVTKLENGIYTVIACPFQNPTPKAYSGKLTIYATSNVSSIAKGVTRPTYIQTTAPKPLAADAGEPSIGSNWKSGAVMFQSGTTTYRVTFNDKAKTSTWTDRTGNTTGVTTLDPILWTDNTTGRTIVSQLLLACSAAEYTDDDGATWVPSQGCGEGTALDHQTIGGGPYPAETAALGTVYPHQVFYCIQGAVAALCARSLDGGLTFGNAVPAATTECGVLHGHIRVAGDGTVYLPFNNCNGRQGVSVSRDGGLTWNMKIVPDSLAGTNDSSVHAGKDGTVYFGYADGTGHAKVAVSRDHGDHWAPSVDVGAAYSIQSTEFSEIMVGDNDRAAYAFLGTPTRGYYQGQKFGQDASGDRYVGGEWHMYVAMTYDRGRTWTTVDATPKDPVQRGCVWNGGGGNKCRNLLDFNDITLDKIGRVMVGFADGCTSYATPCSTSKDVGDNKFESHGAIIRQLTGKTLFKKFDGVLAGSTTGGIGTPTGGGTGSTGGTGTGSGSGSGSGDGGGLATTGSSPLVPALGVTLL